MGSLAVQVEPGPVLVAAAILVAVVVVVMTATVLASLPRNVNICALEPDAADAEIYDVVRLFEAEGFTSIDPPMQVMLLPPAVMVGLIHEDTGAFATVFRAGGRHGVVGYDVVSILENGAMNKTGRGTLTTVARRAGAMLSHAPGCFSQVFSGASPGELFLRHLEALDFLYSRGVPTRPITGRELPGYVREAVAASRRAFLRRPARGTAQVLWRMVTRTNPHMGPLQHQRAAKRLALQDSHGQDLRRWRGWAAGRVGSARGRAGSVRPRSRSSAEAGGVRAANASGGRCG